MARDCEYFPPSHDDELTRLKARIAELERMDTEHTLQITEKGETDECRQSKNTRLTRSSSKAK